MLVTNSPPAGHRALPGPKHTALGLFQTCFGVELAVMMYLSSFVGRPATQTDVSGAPHKPSRAPPGGPCRGSILSFIPHCIFVCFSQILLVKSLYSTLYDLTMCLGCACVHLVCMCVSCVHVFILCVRVYPVCVRV